MDNSKFFEGLNYGQFLRSISTVSKKDQVRVITELGLGTSNSSKNLRRLYSAVCGDKKIKQEPLDYLANAIFVRRLSGGGLGLHDRYRVLLIGLLENFNVPHQDGFIGEEEEKKAGKRLKKIKTGHLKKYLKGRINDDNSFEYLMVFRYMAVYRKLSAFAEVIEKIPVLNEIVAE